RGGGESLTIMGLGKPFSSTELSENGARSRLACGLLRTNGRLVVTDWHRYASAIALGKQVEGELRALDPGLYKVTVFRNVGQGLDGAEAAPAEEPGKTRCHLVWMEKADET